jgi:hypothetical protein
LKKSCNDHELPPLPGPLSNPTEEAHPEWISALPKVTESYIRDEQSGTSPVRPHGRLVRRSLSKISYLRGSGPAAMTLEVPSIAIFRLNSGFFDRNIGADKSGCAPTRNGSREIASEDSPRSDLKLETSLGQKGSTKDFGS